MNTMTIILLLCGIGVVFLIFLAAVEYAWWDTFEPTELEKRREFEWHELRCTCGKINGKFVAKEGKCFFIDCECGYRRTNC